MKLEKKFKMAAPEYKEKGSKGDLKRKDIAEAIARKLKGKK